jgi:hypothetical protein
MLHIQVPTDAKVNPKLAAKSKKVILVVPSKSKKRLYKRTKHNQVLKLNDLLNRLVKKHRFLLYVQVSIFLKIQSIIIGTTFNVDSKYEYIKQVGHGAYGVVCSAYDHADRQKVAIKKVPKAFEDLIDAKRIVREIKLLKFFD